MSPSHVIALLPLLTIALAGCPPKSEDSGDTATAEDTGDTAFAADTLPESSVSSDALSECGPLASAVYMTDPEGQSDIMMMVASTVEDYCTLYKESEAIIDAEWDAATDAYHQAVAQGDYQAACLAKLGWEESYADVGDALMPDGSCTAQVYTATADAGAFALEDMSEAAVIVVQVQGDVSSTIIEAYDGCDGVTDEKSWIRREAEVDAAELEVMPYWMAYEGTVVLGNEDNEVLHASGDELSMMDFSSGELATASFDLWAARCEL